VRRVLGDLAGGAAAEEVVTDALDHLATLSGQVHRDSLSQLTPLAARLLAAAWAA
jgi:hypothetical protein